VNFWSGGGNGLNGTVRFCGSPLLPGNVPKKLSKLLLPCDITIICLIGVLEFESESDSIAKTSFTESSKTRQESTMEKVMPIINADFRWRFERFKAIFPINCLFPISSV
jgi:hypothetical protein